MKLIQKDLPTGRLSFSQIDTYLNCAKKYEWRYIIKPEIVGGNPNMILGSAIHKMIADVLYAKMKKKKYDVEKIKKTSRKFLSDEMEKLENELETAIPDSDMQFLFKLHDKLFDQWLIDILPEFAPTAVESEINTTIAGYPFIMYLDAIHKGKRVVDWKVTTSPKNKYNVRSSLQLSIYSIGAEVDEVAFGSLIKPRAGKEHSWQPRVQIVHDIRTNAERSWAKEVVRSAAEGIRARNFPVCSPENFLCDERYCEMYPICRGKEDTKPPAWMNAFI